MKLGKHGYVINIQWSVVSGQWSVVGGRWSVVGGRQSVVMVGDGPSNVSRRK